MTAVINPRFAVTYLDDQNEKMTYKLSDLSSAKEFVEKLQKEKSKILNIYFYVSILIPSPGGDSNVPVFNKHTFSLDELLLISEAWVQNAVNTANPEIDKYMRETFRVTPK